MHRTQTLQAYEAWASWSDAIRRHAVIAHRDGRSHIRVACPTRAPIETILHQQDGHALSIFVGDVEFSSYEPVTGVDALQELLMDLRCILGSRIREERASHHARYTLLDMPDGYGPPLVLGDGALFATPELTREYAPWL